MIVGVPIIQLCEQFYKWNTGFAKALLGFDPSAFQFVGSGLSSSSSPSSTNYSGSTNSVAGADPLMLMRGLFFSS